jgi:hypothetical protein
MQSYKFSALALVLALGACASPSGVWVKSGTVQREVDQDTYACLQQAQQPYSFGGGGFGWGGYSESSGFQTNPQLYAACMKARGYAWQPTNLAGK